MCKADDGGTAFPRSGFYPDFEKVQRDDLMNALATVTHQEDGMSLLDWFAGRALGGLLATGVFPVQDIATARRVALMAYECATMMIAARKLALDLAPLCQPSPPPGYGEVPPIPPAPDLTGVPMPPFGSGSADGSEDRKI